MKKKIIERLSSGEILVCDGAMGTSLQALGAGGCKAPEELNILNPDIVGSVHKGFIDAGSDMIITNTFGANPIKLDKAGLGSKFEKINKEAIAIAKKASSGQAYVLADIGPTGEFLKPLGQHEEEDFFSAFFKQAAILGKARPDAFIIETMSSLDELRLAVSACRKAARGGIPVIANMTFTLGEKGFRTMMGATIEQFVSQMQEAGCDVIGANCGCGSQQMVEIIRQMKEKIAKFDKENPKTHIGKKVFLIAQPNAGMPKLIDGETVFTETPADFAKAAAGLIKLGVNIIGGCCGTKPEHIREIVKIIFL